MFKKGFWSAAFIGAVLCVGGVCSAKEVRPVEKAAAKLECGGTFYMVSDVDALKPQLSRILDVYAAGLPDGKVKALDVDFVQVRSVLELICKYTGLDRVQAYGVSSTVLVPEGGKQRPVYHNRSVLIMDCRDPKPLLMRLLDGEKTSLKAFAARVPDDAVFAGVFNFNTVEVLDLLKSIPQLPPEILSEVEKEIQSEFQCSLVDFSKGVSGRCEVIIKSLDISGENLPCIVFSVPDKGNRVFTALCKTLADQDPKSDTAVLEEGLTIVKQADRLTLYIGKDMQKKFNERIAAGKTMAADKDFAKFSAKLPAEAHAYGICKIDYLQMQKEAKGIVSVGATVFDKDGMICYSNDSFDCNGQLFALIFCALQQFDEFSSFKDMLK